MKKVKQIQFNQWQVNHLKGLDGGPGCGVRSSLYCSAKSAPFSSSEISVSGLNFSPVCECGRFSSQQYQAVKYPPGKGAAPSQCKLTLLLPEPCRMGNRLQQNITDVLCSHEQIFWNVTVENTSKYFVLSDFCHLQPCSLPFPCMEFRTLCAACWSQTPSLHSRACQCHVYINKPCKMHVSDWGCCFLFRR